MSGPPSRARRAQHADRAAAPPWLLGAVAVLCALATSAAGFTAARGRTTPVTGAVVGAIVALLVVLGLPSLSVRMVARALVAASAALLIRFGLLSGSLVGGGQGLAVWVVSAVGVFVLTDRIGTEASRPLQPTGGPAPSSTGRGPLATGRLVVVVALLVGLVALLLAPLVAPSLSRPAARGDGPNLDPSAPGGASLRASDSLDMTTRPDLTDEVVFTVDADRATFWRGQIFDRWDGRTWTRSDETLAAIAGDQVVPASDDLGAGGSDEVVQRFDLETSYADILFAAASPATIDAPGAVVQRSDGTMVSQPMGRGASYSVVSRRLPLSEEALRAAGAGTVPPDVLARYATPSVVTDRVAAAAERVTAGLTNDYDRILALEEWMGGRTTYSLDAPLAPEGVDVVDDFLFESRQGWCEQIASSLVVLARSVGIPARLVTGYVPGERDALTGDFTVRQRDAHAWAEVWFPELGWVPFDPTADVSLAGSDQADPTLLQWLADHVVYLLVAAGAIGLAVGPLRSLLRRRRAASRTARGRDHGWAAAADRRLDRLGAKAARARSPDETATTYALVLAGRYGDPRLAEVGRAVDDALFAPDLPDEERRAAADAVLAEVAEAGPQPEPPPGPRAEPTAVGPARQ